MRLFDRDKAIVISLSTLVSFCRTSLNGFPLSCRIKYSRYLLHCSSFIVQTTLIIKTFHKFQKQENSWEPKYKLWNELHTHLNGHANIWMDLPHILLGLGYHKWWFDSNSWFHWFSTKELDSRIGHGKTILGRRQSCQFVKYGFWHINEIIM